MSESSDLYPPEDESRLIQHRADVLRRAHRNSETVITTPNRLFEVGGGERFDARLLFTQSYPAIRTALRRHRRLGTLVLALDGRPEPVAEAWMEASLDRCRALIVGRHSRCDLMIPERYGSVSLRQMALLTTALSHADVRTRAIDLWTQTGFSDEAGRKLRAVEADGPVFLRIGEVVLLILTTGEWPVVPDEAEDAYACIPERIFVDEDFGSHHRPRRRAEEDATHVRSTVGPLRAGGALLRDGEPARAAIQVIDNCGRAEWWVGRSALERGILIGRYDRCHLRHHGQLSQSVSRVHTMLLEDRGRVYAVDTASSNGTWHHGREIRLVELGDQEQLALGEDLAVVWRTTQ